MTSSKMIKRKIALKIHNDGQVDLCYMINDGFFVAARCQEEEKKKACVTVAMMRIH